MQKLRHFLAANAAELSRDGAGVLGATLITYGAHSVYAPAGWIVAGAFLLAGAWLSARAETPGPAE